MESYKIRNTMKNTRIYIAALSLIWLLLAASCKLPAPEKKEVAQRVKHNYIILLDLSDRLIVQDRQPQRDKQIIRDIYGLFEDRVRQNLYIKSRDEIKVVIAPQVGTGLNRNLFEDRLYVNMDHIQNIYRRPREEERRNAFFANLDTLYRQAVFSSTTTDYHGADIWKYFYEDLKMDYVTEENTENFLFILTDGYPIVGKNRNKLLEVRSQFPDLHIVLMEAAPREKDLEWDSIMSVWQEWFEGMGIEEYTLIKRGSITKEMEEVKKIVSDDKPTLASR